MIEVGIALAILVAAMAAFSASNMRLNGLRRLNRDRTVAQNAVQTIAERVQAISRAGVSDPGGWSQHVIAATSTGGQLGATFDVVGLTLRAGDAHSGSIVVVTDERTSDATLGSDLGLPRDLNGNGDASDGNVSAGAHLLPVIVRLRWRGPSGEQEIVHPFYVVGF